MSSLHLPGAPNASAGITLELEDAEMNAKEESDDVIHSGEESSPSKQSSLIKEGGSISQCSDQSYNEKSVEKTKTLVNIVKAGTEYHLPKLEKEK